MEIQKRRLFYNFNSQGILILFLRISVLLVQLGARSSLKYVSCGDITYELYISETGYGRMVNVSELKFLAEKK